MALVGDLKDLALVDIIQINCIGRNTARLTVHYPTGDGIFYFQEGDVTDARFGDLQGINAVYQALRYNEGSFRIDTGIIAPMRTIHDPWPNILMEGMRIIDEERAGIIPTTPGLTPVTGNLSGFNSPITPSGGVLRAINPYQALVNDLTKIKGVEGAFVTLRDGALQAQINIKGAEKLGMLLAFMVYHGGHAGVTARIGRLRRSSIISGQKKLILFDQEEFLAAIECSNAIRYETINPYIERAFRKVQMRRGPGSPGSPTGAF